ncbi:TRAM domain-containing protein, partial [Nocardioides sp. NPDC000441]
MSGRRRPAPQRGRRARPKASKGESYVGRRFEVEVGPVAHGGHFVARVPLDDASRVVFVRHALPGEQVVIEITEGTAGDRFWRGDAVSVVSAAPERVVPPCPYAGPGLCGGCDFQHVSVAAQRELKATVVREQLVRLGGLSAEDPLVAGLVVEAVPGDEDGLRWRTRQRYTTAPGGGRGMRKYRSHDVIPVDDCLIATADAREPGAGTVVETVEVGGAEHSFEVSADGFWQVHPGAPAALVSAVLSALSPAPGDTVLDLY